ncbi:LOW QUALITY PROTEIN: interleukin-18 receptor 1-like [Pelodytes ibericus]
MLSSVLVFVLCIAKYTAIEVGDQADAEVVNPSIITERNVTVVEVELGSNVTVKCEAFIGYRKNIFIDMYWMQMKLNKGEDDIDNFVDICEDFIHATCCTPMIRKNKDQSVFAITELLLIDTREDDVNHPYMCKLDTTFGTDTKLFVLRLKEKSVDITHEVFTTSMAISITCVACIVLIGVLSIRLRIELVLLYRNVRGKDETIGDGKEYDAYLSLVDNSIIGFEERTFAFHTLPNILENYFGYKLCIFERDIMPGGSMVDDMNSYLDKCRRLIILLNNNNVSDKATYELESGLHKAMVERKIKVILIELSPLNESNVMLESLQLLKEKNRVKWERDKSFSIKSRFWKQIQYLMPAKPIKPRLFSNGDLTFSL